MNEFPTSRQLEIVRAVVAMRHEGRYAPTTGAIATRLEVTDRGARMQLESLERKGILSCSRGARNNRTMWEVTALGQTWLDAL
jgi:predicted ArsR family transcriptional regulator